MMRGTSIAVAIVGVMLCVAAAGQTGGRVTGNVKLTLANSVPSTASAYERRAVGPRPKAQPEIKSVVIFFSDLPAMKAAPMQASIAQKDEQFVPHLVAVTTGSTVAFPNEDPFFHNVFSLSRGAGFNLGRYPSGSSRSKPFTRPGIVKVFCEIHSHMSAVIRVFDHGWFTVPNDDGTFVIDNVPPGDHTIVAWHERIGERRDRVTIRGGAATTINFTLPVLEQDQ
ncbi:MAG TPA: carboxypeptidase regulatory-like domain-containing protein [Vicinamibacterales bacterium]|nr:carboxypeptidase regulatory-like domain-containing protein [Vicinamibacterales bacterium]